MRVAACLPFLPAFFASTGSHARWLGSGDEVFKVRGRSISLVGISLVFLKIRQQMPRNFRLIVEDSSDDEPSQTSFRSSQASSAGSSLIDDRVSTQSSELSVSLSSVHVSRVGEPVPVVNPGTREPAPAFRESRLPDGEAFRLSCRHVGLTYAQCPLSREKVREFLLSRTVAIDGYAIAVERHSDGGQHLHVYLRAVSKFNVRDCRYFDIVVDSVTYHPNILKPKVVSDWVAYCLKEDAEALTRGVAVKRSIGEAFDKRGVEEAMEFIRSNFPREALISGEAIRNSLTQYYTRKGLAADPHSFVRRYDMSSFVQVHAIDSWADRCALYHAGSLDRLGPLVVIGGSLLGKTSFIRHRFLDHMYFRSSFSLEAWSPEKRVCIMDDVPWEFIPSKKALLIAMRGNPAVVTDKYCRKRMISPVPCIVLLNPEDAPDEFDQYWRANAVVVHVRAPMFK